MQQWQQDRIDFITGMYDAFIKLDIVTQLLARVHHLKLKALTPYSEQNRKKDFSEFLMRTPEQLDGEIAELITAAHLLLMDKVQVISFDNCDTYEYQHTMNIDFMGDGERYQIKHRKAGSGSTILDSKVSLFKKDFAGSVNLTMLVFTSDHPPVIVGGLSTDFWKDLYINNRYKPTDDRAFIPLHKIKNSGGYVDLVHPDVVQLTNQFIKIKNESNYVN